MIRRRILKGAESFQSQTVLNWFSDSPQCPCEILRCALVAYSSLGCTASGDPPRRCKQGQNLSLTSHFVLLEPRSQRQPCHREDRRILALNGKIETICKSPYVTGIWPFIFLKRPHNFSLLTLPKSTFGLMSGFAKTEFVGTDYLDSFLKKQPIV